MSKLYLAYGANTNFDSMKHRCPAARYICNITLNHHQLVFRGVADVVPNRGSKVECALWLITEECEESLDRFEGFPTLYVKRYVTTHVKGRKHRVMLYVMRGQRALEQAQPSAGYERTLRDGYRDCGMPVGQIDRAMQRASKWAEQYGKRHSNVVTYKKGDLPAPMTEADRARQRQGNLSFVDVEDDEAVERALASVERAYRE